jgi:predicted pyridoxine 5'-phosphate oxidase superfamily flavin-nucleotide-binding protein
MAEMPEDLIALLQAWHSVPVATTGADGTPNVAAKSVMVRDPETLVWGELYFMQTYENLRRHPVASLAVWCNRPPFTAYRVNGRTVIHEHDDVAAELDRRVWEGHGAGFELRTRGMAAVVLTVESVWDQTPRPDSAGLRIA